LAASTASLAFDVDEEQMPVINSIAFKKKHGIPAAEGLSLMEIAKLSGMPRMALQEVFDRGIGAYKTNPSSVRPSVSSPEQWAFGRVYSFVMKRKATFRGADRDIAVKYRLDE
jgi:hypothetical protein